MPSRPLTLLVCTALAVVGFGCDSPVGNFFGESPEATLPGPDARTRNTPESADTWTHHGAKAPYSIELSASWSEQPARKLNEYADLAVTQRGQYYLMVIPQPLPAFEGMDTPGAKALRAAGLRRMRSSIDKFRLEDEGPVNVDGVSGVSALAEGLVGNTLLQYIVTFVTHDGWGYQIVGWGPADEEATVVRTIDRALQGWQFQAMDTAALVNPTPDVGTSPDTQSDTTN